MKNDKPATAPPSESAARAKEILKARARELARPFKDRDATDSLLQVIEFRVAQERYAIEQAYVREVYPLRDLTPLPCTPAFVLGIINVRGQILPVIDIRKFFDLPESGITDLHAVIIVHGNDVELGILADAITGARSIPLRAIQPSLPTLTGIRAAYLKGVSDEHVVILNAAQILADPKLVVDEEVGM